ncbi:hypothetical protein AAFC00_006897 [Neodothiora populina]|uniref:RING-type domain-containing protein n=1 Tax=Neodothiora populina TaxID=2781224 RepID=A0ABR3PBJ1_9PEZI
MDFNLRCNSLKCRVSLNDRAVVTTCSHIFCVACADSLSLSDPRVNIRTCPACETQLSNPDDAVVTQLNPTEDYKTSVLSGLSPGLIMECASRGLAFFQYQTTQEIMYQDYMAKSLTDKYAALSAQMDSVINEANAEITSLRDSLSSLHIDKKNLQRKNQELANAFREKSRAQERLQGLYQKLKSQQSAHLIQHAAADDVDTVIHSINGADFVDDLHVGSLPQRTSVAQAKIYNLPPVYDHARAGSSGSGGSKKGQSSIRHNVANTGGVPRMYIVNVPPSIQNLTCNRESGDSRDADAAHEAAAACNLCRKGDWTSIR